MSVADFPKFNLNCSSLLRKYLTKDLFKRLKDRKTSYGFTLGQVICSGVVNQDSQIGVYAGDAESYELFSELFEPIIVDYHDVNLDENHPANLDPADLQGSNPDPADQYILSTRIRVGRNLAGMPLGPAVTRTQRNDIEQQVVSALNSLNDELEGKYYPLCGMKQTDKQRLIDDHFLFKAGDRFLEAAGLNRDWPEGRGIFHNHDKTFLVWVNEEDQLRIISMQEGGDIASVFQRLINGVKHLGKTLPFLFDERLGYLSSCPTNLGTAMRASVHIRLPELAQNMDRLKQLTDRYSLQIRGLHGEHSQSEGGVFDISNRRRLGVTEVQCVQDLVDGVGALIKAEQDLSS